MKAFNAFVRLEGKKLSRHEGNHMPLRNSRYENMQSVLRGAAGVKACTMYTYGYM